MAKAKKAKSKSGGDPLAPVKRNAFWIVLSLTIVVGLVCYFLGSSKVSGERIANLGKINGLSKKAESAVPPDAVADAGRKRFVEDHLKPTRDRVEQTWKSMYDAQLTVFFWPPQQLGDSGEVVEPGLPSNFIDAIKKMPPIEQLTRNHSLDSSLSQTYRNFSIRGQIVRLCKTLKATDFIGTTTVAAGQTKIPTASKPGEKQEEALAEGDLVLWTKRSQESTREEHFNFKESEPPLVDILHAQEDFWVYDTLFRAIAATNEPEGVTPKQPPADAKPAGKAETKTATKKDTDKAAPKSGAKADAKAEKKAEAKASAKETPVRRLEPVIKKVLDVKIGAKYDPPKSTIEQKKSDKTDAGTEQQGETPAEDKLTLPWQQAAQLCYVNEHDQPLKAAEVRELSDGKKEYKRMPVYLKLELDQRSVGDFFVACMQSPVKIEWRQLTITADPQYQRTKPAATTETTGSQTQQAGTEKKSFYDATMELYGVVYILYPPKLPPLQAAEPSAEVAAEEQPAEAAKSGEAAKANTETAKAQ